MISTQSVNKIVAICLFIIGLINFLPLLGILSVGKLEHAYGISITSSDLEILMRHRALLFGILGGFIMASAFRQVLQGAAIIMAAISMMGFILLTYLVGGINSEISNVVLIDWFACILLLVAAGLKYVMPRNKKE